MKLKQIISYLLPVRVFTKENGRHKLEIEWYQGKLLLNSGEANYSYGNLEEVFRMSFRDSSLNLPPESNVLMLGLGGGCVLQLLEDEYHFRGHVKAIEIDADVIDLYHRFYSGNRKSTLEICCADALQPETYLPEGESFDLIICDVFVDLNMPEKMFESGFYQSLKKHLNHNGSIYLNSIPPLHHQNHPSLILTLSGIFKNIRKFSYFEMNEVYLLK